MDGGRDVMLPHPVVDPLWKNDIPLPTSAVSAVSAVSAAWVLLDYAEESSRFLIRRECGSARAYSTMQEKGMYIYKDMSTTKMDVRKHRRMTP